MSEMLSQEEIDALLRGDSAPASPETSNEDADYGRSFSSPLSPEETDALGEIGNISMGTSATTLFTLLNHKVNITTPIVTAVTWDELANQYPSPYVAIQVEYTEGLVGTNLLILKESDVKIITDLMMGGPGVASDEPIGDLHLSAIGEAMNQMIGSSSTSLSTMFNKKIDISPPKAFMVNFQDNFNLDEFNPNEEIVKVAFRMEVGDIIDSEIMQILPIDFAKTLVNNLLNGMASPEPPKQAPPQKTEPRPAAHQPVAERPATPQPTQRAAANVNMGSAPASHPRLSTPQPAYREEQKVVNVQPIQYQSFEGDYTGQDHENIDFIMDVPLEITVELGRTKKLIKDILEFGPGTIIELDKLAGEPVDILVNGKFIAKGEVVVIDESFGVRITDIVSASKRLSKIQ